MDYLLNELSQGSGIPASILPALFMVMLAWVGIMWFSLAGMAYIPHFFLSKEDVRFATVLAAIFEYLSRIFGALSAIWLWFVANASPALHAELAGIGLKGSAIILFIHLMIQILYYLFAFRALDNGPEDTLPFLIEAFLPVLLANAVIAFLLSDIVVGEVPVQYMQIGLVVVVVLVVAYKLLAKRFG